MKWAALQLCVFTAICLTACGGNYQTPEAAGAGVSGKTEQPAGSQGNKLYVCVTFNAMKEFAEAVGGDKADIRAIIPDGTEPHNFEPKAQDLASLNRASVFIYNGLGMETWAGQAISVANNSKLIAIEASKGVNAITGPHGTEAGETYDPHLWLSLKGAEFEAQNIRDGLIQADPTNENYYRKNCEEFVSKTENLYNEYKGKFQSVKKKSFVTGHAAFAYLCRDFGLEQKSVEDVFAEGEPTARQLSELVNYCRDNNVTAIFTEIMASPAVSQTLAREVNARVETVYTIESAEGALTYLERMSDNLSKIYDSLAQ